ncbi:hypothetical protein F8388_007883, partial [Cannabis sativa]
MADPSTLPFFLLLNRDEYHTRPTEPLAWWNGDEILGGKDGLAGGTWLACARDGKIAFLTNVRELTSLPQSKTRGDLPLRFLKAQRLGDNLKELLNTYNDGELPPKEIVEKLMTNTIKDDYSLLPGLYPREKEYHLSSIFVDVVSPLGRYGTRSTSALAVKSNEEVSFYEKSFDSENEEWNERTVTFHINRGEKSNNSDTSATFTALAVGFANSSGDNTPSTSARVATTVLTARALNM